MKLTTNNLQSAVDYSTPQEFSELNDLLEDGDLYGWATKLEEIANRMMAEDKNNVRNWMLPFFDDEKVSSDLRALTIRSTFKAVES